LPSAPVPQAFGPRSATPLGPSRIGTPFSNSGALAVMAETAVQPEASVPAASAPLDIEAIREAVLRAMESGGSQMLVHALEEGNWSCEGNTVSVQVEMSDAMIGVSYTREQERFAAQAASTVAGLTVKVRLIGGAAPNAQVQPKARRASTAASAESIKTRAADEPVVKRMMEKFGAEIRVVMDRSER
jgi:hypothetical protein